MNYSGLHTKWACEPGNMTSYNVEIKQCPTCSAEFAAWAVASGNSFDAKFFTDGCILGSMFDEDSLLLRCPGCNKYFWRENVLTRKSMHDSQYFLAFKEKSTPRLPNAEKLDGRDYDILVLLSFWKSEAQEKHIRIRAWWSFNDAYRFGQPEKFSMSPEQEANLIRLLELLDTNDPGESITRAEILRGLGQFDSCLQELNRPIEERYVMAVDTIKDLAIRKERKVGTIE
jgi:hypothetical protein